MLNGKTICIGAVSSLLYHSHSLPLDSSIYSLSLSISLSISLSLDLTFARKFLHSMHFGHHHRRRRLLLLLLFLNCAKTFHLSLTQEWPNSHTDLFGHSLNHYEFSCVTRWLDYLFNIWLFKTVSRSPGLVVTGGETHNQEVVSLNPGTGYWIDTGWIHDLNVRKCTV